jgi:hypothetical protein
MSSNEDSAYNCALKTHFFGSNPLEFHSVAVKIGGQANSRLAPLKLLDFPEENVSDLRAAFVVQTRVIVNDNRFFFQTCSLEIFCHCSVTTL